MSKGAKFREFCRDHWFDTLLWVLAMAGAGGLVAFLGTLVGLCVEYPLPMGFMAALFFFLGVAWSYMMGIRDWRKARREKREAERIETEKAERERKKKMSAFAAEFKQYEIEAKILACKAHDDGSFVVDVELHNGNDAFSWQARKITERETMPNGEFRYTLTEEAAELLNERPELLEPTRCYLNSESKGQQGC